MQQLLRLIGAALLLLAQHALADEPEPGDMPALADMPAPPSNDPCRATGACARAGACLSGEYRCVARSEADCRASNRCAEGGHCLLDEEQQRCASPAELARPASSDIPETRGPGRPGLVGGGVAVLLAGVGICAGTAAWIAHEEKRSGYGGCNDSQLFCGEWILFPQLLIGFVGTGAIGGGIAMVVIGDRPRTTMVPYPRTAQSPPTIELGLARDGLQLRGSF